MVYRFGGYELDEDNFSLTNDGRRIPLEPKSIQVLLLMVESQGKLLEKSVILDAVWLLLSNPRESKITAILAQPHKNMLCSASRLPGSPPVSATTGAGIISLGQLPLDEGCHTRLSGVKTFYRFIGWTPMA